MSLVKFPIENYVVVSDSVQRDVNGLKFEADLHSTDEYEEKREDIEKLRIRSIPLKECQPYEKLESNLNLWSYFSDCPNLIPIQLVVKDNENLYICSQNKKNIKTLAEYISSLQFYCEEDCREIIRQICLGIKYLHDHGYGHLHLTPNSIYVQIHNETSSFNITNHLDNISVFEEKDSLTKPENKIIEDKEKNVSSNEPIVFIGDFLLSQYLNKQANFIRNCKESIYSAPEIIRGEGYTFEPDIFSIGALVLLMLTGKELTTTHGFIDDLKVKLGKLPVESTGSSSSCSFYNQSGNDADSIQTRSGRQSYVGVNQKMQSSLSNKSNPGNLNLSTHSIYSAIYRTVFMSSSSITSISKNAKNFMIKALDSNMKTRMTIDDCLNHPWLQNETKGVSTPLLLARRAFSNAVIEKNSRDLFNKIYYKENDAYNIKEAILDAGIYEDIPDIEIFLKNQ